jgi:hypothetical protein
MTMTKVKWKELHMLLLTFSSCPPLSRTQSQASQPSPIQFLALTSWWMRKWIRKDAWRFITMKLLWLLQSLIVSGRCRAFVCVCGFLSPGIPELDWHSNPKHQSRFILHKIEWRERKTQNDQIKLKNKEGTRKKDWKTPTKAQNHNTKLHAARSLRQMSTSNKVRF